MAGDSAGFSATCLSSAIRETAIYRYSDNHKAVLTQNANGDANGFTINFGDNYNWPMYIEYSIRVPEGTTRHPFTLWLKQPQEPRIFGVVSPKFPT